MSRNTGNGERARIMYNITSANLTRFEDATHGTEAEKPAGVVKHDGEGVNPAWLKILRPRLRWAL
jgi:hypothetical protein